jgi:hypothetical protein
MSDPMAKVLAYPRAVQARRELARYWRDHGDPRAELIERQLREHDGLGMLSWETVPREIKRLIREHGREWAGKIADLTNDYGFGLGLVARINIAGDEFVKHAADLVKMAPIVHVVMEPPIDLVAVASVPDLSQICTLFVRSGPWLNDAAVTAFANSPNVRGMREIGFAGGEITQDGFAALAGSVHLPRLISIDVTDNPGAEAGRLGTLIEHRYYLLGPDSGPYWELAYQAAMEDYQAHLAWPPLSADITWED